MQFDTLGVVAILLGVLSSLVAYRVILREPRSERVKVQIEEWRKDFGRAIRIVGPILVVLGVLRLFGVGM